MAHMCNRCAAHDMLGNCDRGRGVYHNVHHSVPCSRGKSYFFMPKIAHRNDYHRDLVTGKFTKMHLKDLWSTNKVSDVIRLIQLPFAIKSCISVVLLSGR